MMSHPMRSAHWSPPAVRVSTARVHARVPHVRKPSSASVGGPRGGGGGRRSSGRARVGIGGGESERGASGGSSGGALGKGIEDGGRKGASVASAAGGLSSTVSGREGGERPRGVGRGSSGEGDGGWRGGEISRQRHSHPASFGTSARSNERHSVHVRKTPSE